MPVHLICRWRSAIVHCHRIPEFPACSRIAIRRSPNLLATGSRANADVISLACEIHLQPKQSLPQK